MLKSLAPVYEEVATSLKGKVNVAKVDVPANRDIGTRFDIKGFPTIKLLSHGKVYDFKGRRSAAELEAFAVEGFKLVQPAEIPEAVGLFGEMTNAFKQAFSMAQADVKRGNYFTSNVLLCCLPVVFLTLMVIIIAMPMGDPSLNDQKKRTVAHKKNDDVEPEKENAADNVSDDGKGDGNNASRLKK